MLQEAKFRVMVLEQAGAMSNRNICQSLLFLEERVHDALRLQVECGGVFVENGEARSVD